VLEHEELDAVADQVDDLHEPHRQREPRDRATGTIEDSHPRQRQPQIAGGDQRDDRREDVGDRPDADGRVDTAAEADDDEQHSRQRQQRWQDLDHIPEADACAAEQDPRETGVEDVRHECGRRDRRQAQSERIDGRPGEEDHSRAAHAEQQRPCERPRGEWPQLALAREARDRDAELSEQPREDRHGQDDEDETAAPFRVEEAALDHHECERHRCRDAAEEQRLDRVASHTLRAGNRRPPRVVRRDRRNGLGARRSPDGGRCSRPRGERPARHARETTTRGDRSCRAVGKAWSSANADP
jgi:hypothetical protein